MSRKIVKKSNKQATKSRDRSGMSLATILAMSVVIGMFLNGMYDGLMPIYRKIVSLRYSGVLRCVNEAALDYVLDEINNGTLSLTNVAQNSPLTISSFPSYITQQGSNKPKTTITITNLSASPPTNCVLYDANRPSSNNFMLMTATTTLGGATKSLNVLLEPIAKSTTNYLYGSFGAFGVTTVEFVGLAGINGYNLPSGWPANNPYQFADVGTLGAGNQVGTGNTSRGTLQAGSQFEFPSSQGQFNSAIQYTQNQFNATSTSQASWAQVLGNIYSNGDDVPANSGYWPRSESNDTLSTQSYANVFGAPNGLSLNGEGVPSGYSSGPNSNTSIDIPPYNPTVTPPTSPNYPNWGNVGTGQSYVSGNPTSGPFNPSNPYTGGYVDSYSGYTPPTIAQAPGAPSGTPNLGNIVVNGTLEISPTATMPTSGIGTVPANTTVTIPPGDYSVSTLNVGSSGTIKIDSSVTTQTQLFVNPPSANTGNNAPPAVSFANGSNVNMNGISGNGFSNNGTSGFGATPNSNSNTSIGTTANQLSVDTTNPITETSGAANNLIINTNANCNIAMAGNARAVVNAPNASVNVGAQSVLNSAANFYGAIVAGVCCVISDFNSGAGAYMHYDLNLRRAANGGNIVFTDPWAFNTQQANGNGGILQYRAVSWQEK